MSRESKMIKIAGIFLISLLVLGGLASPASAAINVVVEGPNDEFPHYINLCVPVIEQDGNMMVPLRDVAEALGFKINWDPVMSRVQLKKDNQQIEMTIASPILYINTKRYEMNAAPVINLERTMISRENISDIFSYEVEFSSLWNDSGSIYITPYNLISDSELQGIKNDYIKTDVSGKVSSFKLKKNRVTPSGIQLNSSIRDVLQVYGIPVAPVRSLNYQSDWSGKLTYWGTYIPHSDCGSFWEFTFEQGVLKDLTIFG